MKFWASCSLARRVGAFVALFLAVAWAPISSHEFMESVGFIHQDGPDDDHGPAHDAADGLCRSHDGGILLKAPTLVSLGWIASVAEVSVSHLFPAPGPADEKPPATESPPGLARRWLFVLRLALPIRAPAVAI